MDTNQIDETLAGLDVALKVCESKRKAWIKHLEGLELVAELNPDLIGEVNKSRMAIMDLDHKQYLILELKKLIEEFEESQPTNDRIVQRKIKSEIDTLLTDIKESF